MKNRPGLVSLWLPVLLWCGVIYGLSAIPHLRFFKADLLDFLFRKMGHMVEYGVLARLLVRALTGSTYWPWKKIFAASLVLAMLYSCTDEFHQTFVAGRHGTPRDVIIDTVGAWLALGIKP
jgi:VanZ family protein